MLYVPGTALLVAAALITELSELEADLLSNTSSSAKAAALIFSASSRALTSRNAVFWVVSSAMRCSTRVRGRASICMS